MSFHLPPPNYTQTPNDLFDHWLPLLGEAELKVLLVIMRKTFGWHKTHDAISVSQLTKHTGMLAETVINAAKSLQSKGVITREVVGTPGKQQTIYSLVVADFSNNHYPSVDPSGPLGSSPLGSTESQKKPFLKETIQKKQQQEHAVAASFQSKKEEEKPKVYPVLESVDIPIKDKEEISQKYSIESVDHAIKWALHPQTKLNKGLVQAIKWACKVKPEIPTTPVDLEPVNKAYALQYDGAKIGSTYITACGKYVEIVYGGCQKEPFCLKYDSKGFIDQFTNALRKNNFKILG